MYEKGFTLRKTIYKKIAACVAVLFSILTVVEGSRVLIGITQQEYLVFTPLLIYNLVMGIVGLFIGGMIWFNHKMALMLTSIVTALHLIVLIVASIIFISGGQVAMHSVQAMTIRTVVWSAIILATWKTNQSYEVNTSNITTNKWKHR